MKRNKVMYFLVGLFCLTISSASVYAASQSAENHVGVRFADTTISSTDSSTSSSSTSSSFSSSDSTSTVPSMSTLPDTEPSQKKGGFLFWGNDNGSSGGTTHYYSDNKLLPKTGELFSIALPFAGIFLVMMIFFYLKRDRRKTNE